MAPIASYVVDVDIYLLNDGTQVEIRPIRADDGERLQAAHARLSPESRYRRFLGAKPNLSPADVRHLVEIDGSDHVALVATATVDAEDGAIVAVARFVRIPDDPGAAEFAIVVGDRHQRQGLAGAMIERLATAATERGISRFRATTLSDNVAILGLLEQHAAEVKTVPRGSITELEVMLPGAVEVRAARGAGRSDEPANAGSVIRRRARAMIAACPGG